MDPGEWGDYIKALLPTSATYKPHKHSLGQGSIGWAELACRQLWRVQSTLSPDRLCCSASHTAYSWQNMGHRDTPGRQEPFQANSKLELTNGYDLTTCLETSLFHYGAGVRLTRVHRRTDTYTQAHPVKAAWRPLPLDSFSALSKYESPSILSPIATGKTSLRPSSSFAKQRNADCRGRRLPWSGAHKSSLTPQGSGRAGDSQRQLFKVKKTLMGHPGKALPLFPERPTSSPYKQECNTLECNSPFPSSSQTHGPDKP